MCKHFGPLTAMVLILHGLAWGQTEKNPISAYLIAPELEIIASHTLIPAAVSRFLPQAGLVRLTLGDKKGLPLLFAGSTPSSPTALAPVDPETVRGARTGVLATLASFEHNFSRDIDGTQLYLILVEEEEMENEEVARALKELVPEVEILFERGPKSIAREVFEALLHLVHFDIIDKNPQYKLLSEEIDRAYRESVKAGLYQPHLHRKAYPGGDDIHPGADLVRGDYLATIAKVCYGFFEGNTPDADAQGPADYPFTSRREVQQNDPASYRIFSMLFKEKILSYDDLIEVLSLNNRDEP